MLTRLVVYLSHGWPDTYRAGKNP